jgi:putative oxidoreductase
MIEAVGRSWAPMLLSILRIMSGLLLLQHGTRKLLQFPAPQPNFVLNSMGGYAGIIELAGGILLVIGLFTRPTAFIVSGMCAVAYFYAHAPKGFYPILNSGELAALYCFVFLYIAAAGAGPWSVDALIKKKRK